MYKRRAKRSASHSKTAAQERTCKEIHRSAFCCPVKSGSSHRRSACTRTDCCSSAHAVFSAASSAPQVTAGADKPQPPPQKQPTPPADKAQAKPEPKPQAGGLPFGIGARIDAALALLQRDPVAFVKCAFGHLGWLGRSAAKSLRLDHVTVFWTVTGQDAA